MIPLVTVVFYVVLLGAHFLTSGDPEPSIPGPMADAESDADAAPAGRHGRAMASGAGRDAQSPARLPPSAHAASGAALPPPRTTVPTPPHKPH
jgi:hypothetical protein